MFVPSTGYHPFSVVTVLRKPASLLHPRIINVQNHPAEMPSVLTLQQCMADGRMRGAADCVGKRNGLPYVRGVPLSSCRLCAIVVCEQGKGPSWAWRHLKQLKSGGSIGYKHAVQPEQKSLAAVAVHFGRHGPSVSRGQHCIPNAIPLL